MLLTPAIEGALEACYSALAEPCRWEDALHLLALSVGASACQILPPDHRQRPTAILRSSGESSGEGWQMPQAQIEGFLHWTSCPFRVAEEDGWCLSFFRKSGPFGLESGGLLGLVTDHMARIVGLARKLARAGAERELLALEWAGCAAMLVDWRGSIVGMNHLAQGLLGNDLGVRNGRLWCADAPSSCRLREFMSELAMQEQADALTIPPVIMARAGAPWLLLEAGHIIDAPRNAFQEFRAILVLNDLSRGGTADVTKLSLAFGLTKSEARVAAILSEGHGLRSAARIAGVSYETARSQIKSVFSKTGTHCQSELLARVSGLRGPARH